MNMMIRKYQSTFKSIRRFGAIEFASRPDQAFVLTDIYILGRLEKSCFVFNFLRRIHTGHVCLYRLPSTISLTFKRFIVVRLGSYVSALALSFGFYLVLLLVLQN